MQLRVSRSNLQTQTGPSPRGPSWSALSPSHACLTLSCVPSCVSHSLRAHSVPSTGLGTGGKGKKEVSVLREFTSQTFVLGGGEEAQGEHGAITGESTHNPLHLRKQTNHIEHFTYLAWNEKNPSHILFFNHFFSVLLFFFFFATPHVTWYLSFLTRD